MFRCMFTYVYYKRVCRCLNVCTCMCTYGVGLQVTLNVMVAFILDAFDTERERLAAEKARERSKAPPLQRQSSSSIGATIQADTALPR